MTAPDLPALAAELRAVVAGSVVAPGEPEWETASAPWNRAIEQYPALVLYAADADDVQTAVRLARRHGAAVSVQPNGHRGTRALDGTLLIRTAALNGVEIDTAGRTARVGAGANWIHLLAALDGTGLCGTPGTHPHVNVAAYTLGGGVGWFSRRYGRGSSRLVSAEAVFGDGERRWLTEERDAELLRALRGGGGDYVVVTALELALVDAPRLSGGRLEFPIEDAPAVSAVFADLAENGDEDTGWTIHYARVPNAPQLPEELRGKQFVRVDVAHLGPEEELAPALDRLSAAGTVLRSTVGPREPSQLGRIAEEPSQGASNTHQAYVLDRIDAEVLDVLAWGGRELGLMVQVRALGGALSREAERPSATGPYRGTGLVYASFQIGGPDSRERARAAFAALDERLEGRTRHGLPLTFLTEEVGLAGVFTEEELARLRAVKAAVDPDGVIRGNFPVGA